MDLGKDILHGVTKGGAVVDENVGMSISGLDEQSWQFLSDREQ